MRICQHHSDCYSNSGKNGRIGIILVQSKLQVKFHPRGESRLTDGSTRIVVGQKQEWEHVNVPGVEERLDFLPRVLVSSVQLGSKTPAPFESHKTIFTSKIKRIGSTWSIRIDTHGVDGNRERDDGIKDEHPLEGRHFRVLEPFQKTQLQRSRNETGSITSNSKVGASSGNLRGRIVASNQILHTGEKTRLQQANEKPQSVHGLEVFTGDHQNGQDGPRHFQSAQVVPGRNTVQNKIRRDLAENVPDGPAGDHVVVLVVVHFEVLVHSVNVGGGNVGLVQVLDEISGHRRTQQEKVELGQVLLLLWVLVGAVPEKLLDLEQKGLSPGNFLRSQLDLDVNVWLGCNLRRNFDIVHNLLVLQRRGRRVF